MLDCGATGVLIPHVSSADYARGGSGALSLSGGKRGFATSTRGGPLHCGADVAAHHRDY